MRFLCLKISMSALACLVPGLCIGQVQQVPVGPRAIAMGGAFSAIADDASAVFWNPAGLPQIGHQEIVGTRANLFGTDIVDNHLAFILPITRNHALAADWYHSGFEDPELNFGENRFGVAYGFRPHPKISVGTSLKLLTRNTDLDGATVRDGNGVGMDLGVLVSPAPGLRLGLVGQDIFDTEIGYSNGLGNAVAYPRNVRAGLSYTYREWGTAAVDLDDRLHIGTEILPLDMLALRTGFQKDTDGDESATWSFGAGFKWNIFHFDYAYEIHPVLDNTSHFGFALAFHFNPAQIRIEEVKARNLYASLHKTYANEPIGTVRVRNLKNQPLTTRISVFVPGMMKTPTEREVVLRPKATQEVPINMVFSEELMALEEDRPIQIQVEASYRSARVVRTDKASGKTTLYRPGAISWGEGVSQAAAFVTTSDPVVATFAREASRTVVRMGENTFQNRNLGFAAAMFDALDVLGMAYVPDPNNPFKAISETEDAVDTIHYPRETLSKRVGDCDDTSVLMASLLGNVGVPTKLVDVPGHLMILVGTGIHEKNRLGLALDESYYVVADHEIWIPLETTALGKGFAEAWRLGVEAYKNWESRGRVALADVSASQGRYEPALPSGHQEAPSFDTAALQERLVQDQKTVGDWRRSYLASRYQDVETTVSSDALIDLAHVYFLAGQGDEARAKLEEALRIEPDLPRTNNNLGVVFVVLGNVERGVQLLRAAAQRDPADPGIKLNLGLALYASGEATDGARTLEEGIRLAGGYEPALQILGVTRATPGRAAGPEGDPDITTRDLLRAVTGEGDGVEGTPSPDKLSLYWKP